MMTSRQQVAMKMIEKFRSGKVMFPLMEHKNAIQCAIICVEQIINSLGESREAMLKNIRGVIGIDLYFTEQMQFWIDVKSEIEKS
jgi:hypothetical protein